MNCRPAGVISRKTPVTNFQVLSHTRYVGNEAKGSVEVILRSQGHIPIRWDAIFGVGVVSSDDVSNRILQTKEQSKER